MIVLRDVSHVYSSQGHRQETLTRAVDQVTLTVPARQFLSIVGPSGCGKTTLLRLIAGLIRPAAGTISVGGRGVEGPGPDRAIVFQDAGLYPWRTVAANVRLGLELSGIANGKEADRIVDHHLGLVGLGRHGARYPGVLSGGMQQRVGLARALAVSPSLLLMDEPFGSLDAITRRKLGAEVLRIWERDQRTVVFVTHSLDEALTLSDRTVMMRDGGVVADVEVDLPRPRDPVAAADEPRFRELRQRLWELL